MAVAISITILLGPILSSAITLCIVLIDLNLFALMVLLDIVLDAVSFTALAIAIGLCVDYSVHIGVGMYVINLLIDHTSICLCEGETEGTSLTF